MPRKPDPLFLGGHYHYTLSSYDPVEVTVTVPRVTDAEVHLGTASVLRESGLEGNAVPSDAWVRDHVEGVASLDELKSAVRSQLEAMSSDYAETSKFQLCAEELAKRLEQSVPLEEVAHAREALLQNYEMQTQSGGFELSDALAGMGLAPEQIDAMLDQQARHEAEHDAALDAYADKCGITVDETALPALLGLSPKDAQGLIARARAQGQMDSLLAYARRRRAAEMVAAEAHCSYEHETEQEAQERMAALREHEAAWTMPDGTRPDDEPQDESQDEPRPDSRSHLKLV